MRCHFRHGLVKGIVKAGEMRHRREDRVRGSDKRESLRDVQRRKMYGGAQFVQQRRGDELVRAEIGAPVHDAMTYCYWRGVCSRIASTTAARALLCDSRMLSRCTSGSPVAERMCNLPLLCPMPSALPVSSGSSSLAPR